VHDQGIIVQRVAHTLFPVSSFLKLKHFQLLAVNVYRKPVT